MIDPSANAVIAQWPTAPATRPPGLALDAASHRIFSTGANGKLVAIDTGTNPPIKAQKPFPPLKPLRSELLDLRRLIPIFSCIRYDIAI